VNDNADQPKLIRAAHLRQKVITGTTLAHGAG
jgi:hypothetical protein